MRSVGVGLALIASVQFAVLPAFAADATQPPAKSAVAKKKKKPAKTTTEVTVHTTSGDVPAPAATVDAPAPTTTTTTVTTPAPAPEPVAPAVVVAVPAPVNPPGTVTVHVDSPKPVSLEKRADAHSAWEYVCNSPCDIPVSTSAEYHIVGVDLNDSNPFVLDSSLGEKVTLDVTPGNHNKAARGGWILVAGGALAVGGLVTLLVGSKNNDVQGNNGTSNSTQNGDAIFVGSALIVAGLIAGITGGAFIYDNSHTRVEGGIGAVPDKKVQTQVPVARLPQWHEDTGPQLAASRFVSVLQGTF